MADPGLNLLSQSNYYYYFIERLILERKGGRRETEIINLLYLFMYSLADSYMCPEIKPTTLAYRDNVLTKWDTRPGPKVIINSSVLLGTVSDTATLITTQKICKQVFHWG